MMQEILQTKILKVFLIAIVIVCSPRSGMPVAGKDSALTAARIVIVKSERSLTLLRKGKILKTYKVALGTNPIGAKTRQDDGKTPEGVYSINSRNAHSQFHLSLHISYPNAADRARAAKLKVSAGGDIMIHGLPPAYAYLGPLHRKFDWTLGCIAVTDGEIEEIWKLAPIGTVVEIKP